MKRVKVLAKKRRSVYHPHALPTINLVPALCVLLIASLGAGATIFSVLYFLWSLL